jgi:hypothetical protein
MNISVDSKIDRHNNKQIMSAPRTTSGYMIFFRGNDWDKNLSPEEIQKVTSQFMAWFERLSAEGIAKGGAPLEVETRVVSASKGRIVSDGPFAESKEAIAGFFLLDVENMEQAVEIAKQCPTLQRGVNVEVRQVAPECPHMRLAEQLTAHAAA